MRPTVKLVEGSTREIEWPENAFSAAPVPGAEGDLVMLQGVEPSLRWRRFTEDVVEAARASGSRMVITLGRTAGGRAAQPPGVDHRDRFGRGARKRLGFEPPSYEGPTGIVGVVQQACAEAGLPAVSLWASVPHYVAAAPNPKVALALVRAFEGAAGLAVDGGELETRGR